MQERRENGECKLIIATHWERIKRIIDGHDYSKERDFKKPADHFGVIESGSMGLDPQVDVIFVSEEE